MKRTKKLMKRTRKLTKRTKKLIKSTKKLTKRTKKQKKIIQYGGRIGYDELVFIESQSRRIHGTDADNVHEIIATLNGKNVGSVKWNWIQPNNTIIYIAWVEIPTEFKGQGICPHLINKLITSNPDVTEVQLISETSPGGVACYLKTFANRGFTRVFMYDREKHGLFDQLIQFKPENMVGFAAKQRVDAMEINLVPFRQNANLLENEFFQFLCTNFRHFYRYNFIKDDPSPKPKPVSDKPSSPKPTKKHTCACGSTLSTTTSGSEKRHLKTKKHLLYESKSAPNPL